MSLHGKFYLGAGEPPPPPDVEVMNPKLYGAMRLHFGKSAVRVINDGETMAREYGVSKDPRTCGSVSFQIESFGETYATDCPFCGDSRGRLSINYLFGVYDNETGRRHEELWKCYNSECQTDYVNRRDLYDRLESASRDIPKLQKPAAGGTFKGLVENQFKGTTVPLAELDNDHPAAKYLADRGFNRFELYLNWGLGLATDIDPVLGSALDRNRIIIPVNVDGVMVGWQSRFVGDLDWKAAGVAKYLTHFPKSKAVYGIDEAESHPYLVLVEGATDVWRYGHGAICCLGKSASPTQIKIIAARLRGRPLVLVPDQNDPQSVDAFIKTARAVVGAQETGTMPSSPVSVVAVPEGCDPGDLDRAVFHTLVASAVADPVWVAPTPETQDKSCSIAPQAISTAPPFASGSSAEGQ